MSVKPKTKFRELVHSIESLLYEFECMCQTPEVFAEKEANLFKKNVEEAAQECIQLNKSLPLVVNKIYQHKDKLLKDYHLNKQVDLSHLDRDKFADDLKAYYNHVKLKLDRILHDSHMESKRLELLQHLKDTLVRHLYDFKRYLFKDFMCILNIDKHLSANKPVFARLIYLKGKFDHQVAEFFERDLVFDPLKLDQIKQQFVSVSKHSRVAHFCSNQTLGPTSQNHLRNLNILKKLTSKKQEKLVIFESNKTLV
jgi:hypothetical protein